MTEKMHTLKLSEKEIAAILFLLNKSNGKSIYRIWTRCKDILVGGVFSDDFENKHKSLSEKCGFHDFIDYHSVEQEWESFLGIGEEVKNKEMLSKITDIERAIIEMKGLLCLHKT